MSRAFGTSGFKPGVPGGTSRGAGAMSARAIIRTQTRLRGRGRLLGERSRSVAGLDTPPICVPQRREGLSKTTGADVRYRPAQARRFAAAPGREETAEALRRCVAGLAKPPSCVPQGRGSHPRHAGPWPDWTRRLFAYRKGGKVSVKPPARTCVIVLHRRGVSPPPQGAKRQPRHWARRYTHELKRHPLR